MMEIILTLREDITVPVELDALLPEKMQDMDVEEIKNIEVPQGRTTVKVGEIFDVKVIESDIPKMTIKNSSIKLKRVGEGMTTGEIVIEGDVGMHVGAEMKGGRIVVNGNADNWAGQGMKGGELIIKGNAGNYIGSAYRGGYKGMSGGLIVVEGNAGHEIGEHIVGGMIHIKGNVGYFVGIHAKGGIIRIDGDVPGRLGAEMIKGAIVVNGKVSEVLPSFKYEGIVENPVIKIKKKDEGTKIEGVYHLFTGDYVNNKPKGQLYISVASNPHLG
ncbi:formylmethanofuran dehydrogenase subunit C [Methanofervidicoccus sp. A16]|nr:tungsten-dependent formylmethanofuran dehydrogenase subunit FwdC [Methanofervidicoccus sp. A16]AXI25935.1 formylmethanofuran dehydrogenase subunit C [Methanofervidicoccus sp. A16]